MKSLSKPPLPSLARLVPNSPKSSTTRLKLKPSLSSVTFMQHDLRGKSATQVASRLRHRLNEARAACVQLGKTPVIKQASSSSRLKSFKAGNPVKVTEKIQKIDWRQGEVIGCGSEGTVYKAMNTCDGQIFAVKKFFVVPAGNRRENVQEEGRMLQRLDHPHVIRYQGCELTNDSFSLFLEYMPGGSVKSLIENIGPLPESTVKVYTKQILRGLLYLHSQKVIHRDIKSANLLLTEDGHLKLSDFGCAKQYKDPKESGFVQTIKGSLAWTAPEVVQQKGYGRKSDIWSLGCTVIEMLSGSAPWEGVNDYIAVLIKLARTEELPPIPSTCSDLAKNFIGQCLTRPYLTRPSVKSLLRHSFLI